MRESPFSRMTSAFHTPMTWQAPGCFGFDFSASSACCSDLARVFDSVARAHRERVASDRARQLKVALGVVRVCRDGAPRVLFRVLDTSAFRSFSLGLNSPRSTASWAALTSQS